jgi:hypothetical protein
MNALYEEHKARGLTLWLVNMGEDADFVRQTVKARGYTATVLLDARREVADAYGVTATPIVYLIDRGGQFVARVIGRRDWTGPVGRRLLAALLAS